jgi:membrane fusion protein (multidrug efflux system)
MPATFTHSLRSLHRDTPRVGVLTVTGTVLCLGWGAWLLCGRVPVYEVTDRARLEVTSAVHPVTAEVGGRVLETRLILGREVRAGEILVVLDAEAERRALDEKHVRRQVLGDRLAALRREIQTEREALPVQQLARTVALAEARALAAEAEARSASAQRQAETSARLWRSRAVSAEELRRDQAEATARRAGARALQLAPERQEQDRRIQESERQTRLARLEREAVELEGEAAIEAASIRRLEYDLTRRSLRAPISGRIGEAAEVHVGTVVREAEKLGAIVPAGQRRAVAEFPVAAVGRLRPDQPARLRLDGFPWTQYGTLAATVADIATEAVAGRVRVELTLAAAQEGRAPVEHGLTGSAEVEVERVAPAVLLLRAAGQMGAGKSPGLN